MEGFSFIKSWISRPPGKRLSDVGKGRIPSPSEDRPLSPRIQRGMRQRVMIAMALSCNPKLLIADEPTTALDVTVEAQIINLMQDLQDEMGMSIIMITHDLGVIAGIADRVLVMYAGWVVEEGSTEEIFYSAKHPYTQALLQSVPRIGRRGRLNSIKGTVPDLINLPRGWCYFAPRCSHVMDICLENEPPMCVLVNGRRVKCWLYQEGEASA